MKMNNRVLYEKIMRNVSKEIKRILNEDVQHFDVTDYDDDDDIIVDNKDIDNITYADLPDFMGSSGIKTWLLSYDWEDRTNVNKFEWEGESSRMVGRYLADNITNILYAETDNSDPLYMLHDLIIEFKEKWPQHNNDWWESKNNKYCCISFYGDNEIQIFQYNGRDDNISTPKACVIRPFQLGKNKYAITITIYSDQATFYRNIGTMIHAPIELFDLLYKFAEDIHQKYN